MMSDVMLFGVLNMPYELAMGDEMSRMQHYNRVKQALALIKTQADHIATLEQESAANLQRALVAEKSTLTIALPDYEKRRIVIASDDYADGERIVCVVINNNGSMYAPAGYVLVPVQTT